MTSHAVLAGSLPDHSCSGGRGDPPFPPGNYCLAVVWCQHGELFERYGASVRVLGDRSLVRDDVLEQVDKAVEMTKHNEKAVLNVCFPYTGREEIVHSIRETVREYSSPPERRAEKRPFSESACWQLRGGRNFGRWSVLDDEPRGVAVAHSLCCVGAVPGLCAPLAGSLSLFPFRNGQIGLQPYQTTIRVDVTQKESNNHGCVMSRSASARPFCGSA